MKAEKIAAARLFAGGQQLRVPVWQRRYSWQRSEWSALYKDLDRLDGEPAKQHFIGSVVLRAELWSGQPPHATRFDLVDGQQRVATLTLLLLAVRDTLKSHEGSVDEASALTTQMFVNADKAPDHQRRLVLQPVDDPELAAILAGQAPTDDNVGLVTQCYRYFMGELRGHDENELHDVVRRVQTQLDAVWITLTAEDSAHRVFQTINAGGRPLHQTDLVRNFFFLLLGEKGKSFYREHWEQLEHRFTQSELGSYFSAWTVVRGHKGSMGSLFSYFNKDLVDKEQDPDKVWAYGEELVSVAPLFSIILGHDQEEHADVARSLLRLQRWGTAQLMESC